MVARLPPQPVQDWLPPTPQLTPSEKLEAARARYAALEESRAVRLNLSMVRRELLKWLEKGKQVTSKLSKSKGAKKAKEQHSVTPAGVAKRLRAVKKAVAEQRAWIPALRKRAKAYPKAGKRVRREVTTRSVQIELYLRYKLVVSFDQVKKDIAAVSGRGRKM